MAGLAIALAMYVVLRRRSRAVTDVMATRIDADAGLGGELRSAHWFAGQPAATAWPLFHLQRAAARIEGVAWASVYPPTRANRAWGATAVFAVAALALTIHVPPPRPRASVAATLAGAAARAGVLLPPDVAKRLQDLLAAAEAGTLSAEDAKKLADLNNLLKKFDPNADPQLAELAKRIQEAAANAAKGQKQTIGDLAKAGDVSATPEDLKKAMEDLASKLASGQTGEKPDGAVNTAPNSNEGQFGKASAQAQVSQANAVQAAVQLVREAATDPGQSQPMMGGGAMGGDPSAGRGGNSTSKNGAADLALKAEALRRELVEANTDTPGSNVSKEDLRRKTEQGKSGLAFTRAAAASTVDRSRAVPPPPVPDARRALVQSFFIRIKHP
jgi:hypothetical protein